MGLQIALVMRVSGEDMLEDPVGLSEPLLDIAAGLEHGRIGIGGVRHRLQMVMVTGNAGVDFGGAGPHRFQRVEDGGQFFVVHLNEVQGLLCSGSRLSRHPSHPLSDEADAVSGQDRHVPHPTAEQDIGKLLAAYYSMDPWHSPGPGGIDAEDASVRVRATQDLAPEYPGQLNVGGEDSFPGDLIDAVDLRDSLSNYGEPTTVGHTEASWKNIPP